MHHPSRPSLAALAARFGVCAALAGCAHTPPAEQSIEVRVEAEAPDWAGPLDCEAANGAGRWAFSAPGRVSVSPSTTPLQITCKAPAGAVAEPSVTPAGSLPTRERARQGAATGAKVGAGAGVALGAAAAPVMGGAFAVLIAAGTAMRGGEIGGLVGSMRSGDKTHYPDTVVLRVRNEAAAADR